MANTDDKGEVQTQVYVSVSLTPIGLAAASNDIVAQARIELTDLDGADLPRLVEVAARRLLEESHD